MDSAPLGRRAAGWSDPLKLSPERTLMPMSVLWLVGTSVLEGRLTDHAVVDEKVATW